MLIDWLPRSLFPSAKRRALRRTSLRSPTRLRLENLESRVVLTVTFHAGGDMLTNVNLQAVYLGSDWNTDPTLQAQQAQLETYLSYLVTSPFMDLMSTEGYGVYRGTTTPGVVDAITNPSVLDDNIIEFDLQNLINTHQVQAPGANTVYVVYVDPGIKVTQGGGNSVLNFLGYHGSFIGTDTNSNHIPIRYEVLPYPGPPGPSPGSQGFASVMDELTFVTSHETAEAVTDPDAERGLLTWYDELFNGEVADLAFGSSTIGGYLVTDLVAPNDVNDTDVSASFDALPFNAPTGLSAVINGANAATLSWTNNWAGLGTTFKPQSLRVYEVAGTTKTLVGTFSASATTGVISNLVPGLTYNFEVAAVDGPSEAFSTAASLDVPPLPPPLLLLNSTTAAYVAGSPPVVLAPNATLLDGSANTYANGNVTVNLSGSIFPTDQLVVTNNGLITASGNTVSYGGLAIGTFTGGTGGNALVISLNSAANVTNTQALIQAIGFQSTLAQPDLTPRSVLFSVTDGFQLTAIPQSMTINLSQTDLSPTLTLSPQVPYTANTPAISISPAALVTDPDSPFFTGGSLSVTEVGGTAADFMTVLNQGTGPGQISVNGLVVSDGGVQIGTINSLGSSISPLIIGLNSNASVGAVQDLVRAIGFGVTGQTTASTRTFDFSLSDGGTAAPATAAESIVVNVVNFPPAVTIAPSVNYSVGALPVLISPSATVIDPDSPSYANGSLYVAITQNSTFADRLFIQNQGTGPGQVGVNGNTVTYGGVVVGTLNPNAGASGTPLVVTFGAQATPAAAQAILAAVTFGTQGATNTSTRQLQVVVKDGLGVSNVPVYELVNIGANATPVSLTLGSASMNYTRGTRVLVDTGAMLVDTNAASFAGGQLTFGVTGGKNNQLTLINTAAIHIVNGHVKFNGVTVGTLQGHTVRLNGNATDAAVEALIGSVVFHTTGRNTATRTVTFTFFDGAGGSASASKSIFVH